jgi:hypothetical protein
MKTVAEDVPNITLYSVDVLGYGLMYILPHISLERARKVNVNIFYDSHFSSGIAVMEQEKSLLCLSVGSSQAVPELPGKIDIGNIAHRF